MVDKKVVEVTMMALGYNNQLIAVIAWPLAFLSSCSSQAKKLIEG
jgi:hypothetical protein